MVKMKEECRWTKLKMRTNSSVLPRTYYQSNQGTQTYGSISDNLSLIKSTKNDPMIIINMFEPNKIESTSSPSTNDLKYRSIDQPSQQLKSKHKVHQNQTEMVFKKLKREVKEKIPNYYQNSSRMVAKITQSQKYYTWIDLKSWMQKDLEMIKK